MNVLYIKDYKNNKHILEKAVARQNLKATKCNLPPYYPGTRIELESMLVNDLSELDNMSLEQLKRQVEVAQQIERLDKAEWEARKARKGGRDGR